MDTETAKTWIAFVDAGCNLSKAAVTMSLSQPAVHAKLRSLSRAVDAQLYERRGRGLILTAAGTHVSAWAKDAVASERLLRAKLRHRDDVDRVVLACGEGVFVHVIASRIATHLRTAPLVIQILDGKASVDAVMRGEADIAVAAGPAAHEPSLRTTTLCATSLLAVVARNHPLARLREVDASTLCQHPLVIPPRGRPMRAVVEDWAATHGVALQVAAESTSWEAVMRLAQLGVGVGVINDIVSSTRLSRLRIRGAPKATYRVLTRKGRQSDAVAAVLALLAPTA